MPRPTSTGGRTPGAVAAGPAAAHDAGAGPAATRVVVTGLGVVSPVGSGWRDFWKSLCDGRSGVAPVESFDTGAFDVHLGAEVAGFRPEEHVRTLDHDSLGRASCLAIAAARQAVEDAGLEDGLPSVRRGGSATGREREGEDPTGAAGAAGNPTTRPQAMDPGRVGVAMGTTSGEPREVERFDDRWLAGELDETDPGFVRRYPCHVLAGSVAAELGLAGVVTTIPTACAAGSYAVAHALDTLRAGRADLMLAGGSDSFSRITYTGFARLGAIAPDRCRPFDRDRKGMIPGEGAAVVVLEPLEAAQRRGATIRAEVLGYGLSCDAHHMTGGHPEADGAVRAMEQALRRSGLRPDQVSYVSAHGTGTPGNDRMETLAAKRVFGGASAAVPMSSVKSMLGHTMGAASAMETVVCALAALHDVVPPTINLETPDPECDLDYVPGEARELDVDVVMNNAYAFGGTNASVILGKYRP